MIIDWEKTYNDIIKFENKYLNNENEEVYKGISRKIWGNWNGWKLIDKYKKYGYKDIKELNKALITDAYLETLVVDFYKRNFWNMVHGDELPSKIARKLFDTAVDLGVRLSIVLLQKSLNGINIKRRKNKKTDLFITLQEDGKYGKKTAKAIQAVFAEYGKMKGQEEVLDWYCEYQAERYHAIVTRNPNQKVFLKGWLHRASYRGD